MTQEDREILDIVKNADKEEKAKKRAEREQKAIEREEVRKQKKLDEERIQKAVEVLESPTQKFRVAQMIRTGGETTASLSAFNEIFTLPPIDTNNAEEVANRCIEYFNICADKDIKPGLEGLCLALGMHRTTFFRIEQGGVKRSPEVKAVFQQAHQMLSAEMEYFMTHGKINPASGIFILKNNYGYKDTTENVVITESEEKIDAEAIRKKYLL